MIPRRIKSLAGVPNAISKQIKCPNSTPKSVSNVPISDVGVVEIPLSPKRLNFRYLKTIIFIILNCLLTSAINLHRYNFSRSIENHIRIVQQNVALTQSFRRHIYNHIHRTITSGTRYGLNRIVTVWRIQARYYLVRWVRNKLSSALAVQGDLGEHHYVDIGGCLTFDKRHIFVHTMVEFIFGSCADICLGKLNNCRYIGVWVNRWDLFRKHILTLCLYGWHELYHMEFYLFISLDQEQHRKHN